MEKRRASDQYGINCLSLFDGISCEQQALKELGIPIGNYYACEIDKFAIKVTQKNHPETIQLGDVTKLDPSELPKIDLLLAGSPCQGFSSAGVQKGFDDPRSKLFFEFLKFKEAIEPTYFLLENVSMKKEWLDKIDFYTGVKGVKINSCLFSAQSRTRYYWTNLQIPPLPESNPLTIADICDPNAEFKEYSGYRFYPIAKHSSPYGIKGRGGLLSPTETLRKCANVSHLTTAGLRMQQRVIDIQGKHPTLISTGSHPWLQQAHKYRKPTLIELERLQTLSDGYTAGVSKTQRIKMIGNAWNIDTIKHLLRPLQNC